MKKIVTSLYLLCCVCMCQLHAANNVVDSLLSQLDHVIQNRPVYIEQKEKKLNDLRQALRQRISDENRFTLLGEYLDEYRSYNTDSSLYISRERYQVALRMKNKEHQDNALMNTAEIMGTAGMYKEAVDLMHNVQINHLPDDLHPYYYHIYRTVYGLMADYAVTEQEKKLYAEITDRYRDSLLLVNKDNLLVYTLIQSDQHNVRGEFDKAIQLLTDYLAGQIDNVHDVAICAYTLSESYRLKEDTEKEKEYLILSSIADMKSAVREYISLRKLAVLLYQEGDIDRAYSYLKLCMDDAVFCNARLRILEILQIFPLINDTYQQKAEKQQEQMKWALVSISLLSIFLLIAIFYVYKQMKRVAAARHEVIDANKRLKELNEELHRYNLQLKEANHIIAENSYLKEEFIEEELKEFYANFDNTFLQLFPTFVEDFNTLLAEGEQIYPKVNERMSTELRIFALIRLGITDSVKIAQFLRYSVTTIYNYRTKVRNKAAGDRDQLEQEVMKIGKSRD